MSTNQMAFITAKDYSTCHLVLLSPVVTRPSQEHSKYLLLWEELSSCQIHVGEMQGAGGNTEGGEVSLPGLLAEWLWTSPLLCQGPLQGGGSQLLPYTGGEITHKCLQGIPYQTNSLLLPKYIHPS
jgi:hypothetical protein